MNTTKKGSISNPVHERKRRERRKSLKYQETLKKIAERRKVKNYVV